MTTSTSLPECKKIGLERSLVIELVGEDVGGDKHWKYT
jgi:hypothetical protein